MNKKFLAVAITGAMTAPMAAQAVKYKLSGQVNRAIVFQDDGENSAVRNVDGTSSGTRFRLRGSEDLGNGMQVGFYWEYQTSSNGAFRNRPGPETTTGGNPIGTGNGDNTRNLTDGGNLRQANVFFSGNWGKVTIGQTDGAGNGATEADLSGTGLVVGSFQNTYTGGMLWRTSGGRSIGVANGSTYTNNDAFSRYDQVRYDSPALGPVTLAASIGNDNRWETAGRLNTGLWGGKVSAALFYGQDTGRTLTDVKSYGGSLSYLFSQGTSITGHASAQSLDGANTGSPLSWSVKLGHKWGPNAASIGYGQAEDFVNNYTQQNFNVAYVRSLKRANTQLYAMYTFQTLDDRPTGTLSVEDHNAFVTGARVRFD